MRIKAICDYDGTAFVGWQNQPNGVSIQEKIEQNLKILLKQKISVIGCGRTDAGVHAKNYCFHFDHIQDQINLDELKFKLNCLLPQSIAILNFEKTDDTFHARFDAKKRSYTYCIHTVKSPFKNQYSYFLPKLEKSHLEILNNVAAILYDVSDFTSLKKTNSDNKTNICHLYKSKWQFEHNAFTYHIEADRFLRGMVRLIVGSSLNVAFGKISIGELANQIINKKSLSRPFSAPAHGLTLHSITY